MLQIGHSKYTLTSWVGGLDHLAHLSHVQRPELVVTPLVVDRDFVADVKTAVRYIKLRMAGPATVKTIQEIENPQEVGGLVCGCVWVCVGVDLGVHEHTHLPHASYTCTHTNPCTHTHTQT